MHAKTAKQLKAWTATALAAALALYPTESVWAQARTFTGNAGENPVRPLTGQNIGGASLGASSGLLQQTALSGASLGALAPNASLPASALQNSAASAARAGAQAAAIADGPALGAASKSVNALEGAASGKLRALSAQAGSPAQTLGRETARMSDALKDLPDMREASAGAAFGAGVQLTDRITRQRSLSTSDDVAADLSLAADASGLGSLARSSGLNRASTPADGAFAARVPAPAGRTIFSGLSLAKPSSLLPGAAALAAVAIVGLNIAGMIPAGPAIAGVLGLLLMTGLVRNPGDMDTGPAVKGAAYSTPALFAFGLDGNKTVSQFLSELPDKLSHVTVSDALLWAGVGLGAIFGAILAFKLIRGAIRLTRRLISGKKAAPIRFKDIQPPSMATDEFLELLANALPADASVDEMAAAVDLEQRASAAEPVSAQEIQQAQKTIVDVATEMGTLIVGQKELILALIMALIARKHVEAEGVPGIAKTLIMRTFASTIDGATFGRIQGASDLLPADIIGTQIIQTDLQTGNRYFEDKKGPIFRNIVLFDEGNRAPPKAYGAVLAAMEEGVATIGDKTYDLPKPFLVLWTQNPIEQEGTYPISEAQLDRFMFKIIVNEPDLEELVRIAELHSDDTKPLPVGKKATLADFAQISQTAAKVRVDPALMRYAASLVFATRAPGPEELKTHSGEGLAGLKKYVKLGASPRAVLGLVRAAKIMALVHGRGYVLPEDIKRVAYNILRHRVRVNYTTDNVTSEQIITKILDEVLIPGHEEEIAAGEAPAPAPPMTSRAAGRLAAQLSSALALSLATAFLFGVMPYAIVPLAGLSWLGILALSGINAAVGFAAGMGLHKAIWSKFYPEDKPTVARLKAFSNWAARSLLKPLAQFATALPFAIAGALLFGAIPYAIVPIGGLGWLGILALSGIPALVGIALGAALHNVIWGRFFPKQKLTLAGMHRAAGVLGGLAAWPVLKAWSRWRSRPAEKK